MKKKKKRKKKSDSDLHPSVQEFNQDYGYNLKGVPMEEQVRTETAEDGVDETRITYVPRKKQTIMKPIGDKYEKIFGKKGKK